MNEIYIDKNNILEYIGDTLSSFKIGKHKVYKARYHHNSSYKNSPSIIKNGILSLSDINDLSIRRYTKEHLEILSDVTSHVNGNDGISLSVPYLDDLYEDEFEYNPFNIHNVDFLISSDIRASRNSTHYGNEFISYERILPDKLRSVDIRLLTYLSSIKDKHDLNKIFRLIHNFNEIKDIALALYEKGLYMPFREMSYSDSELDIEKIANMPKLYVK